MGQTYRYDPERGTCTHQEPSPGQLRWLQQCNDADVHLPTLNRVQVMRACQERGWVRSDPPEPDYLLGYYSASWFITPAGRAEVKHYRDRARLAEELGVADHRALSKLMD